MSFDVHLMAFRNGVSSVGDAVSARRIVDAFQFDLDSQLNVYRIMLDDGARVEMYADGIHSDDKPFDNAMIALRGESESTYEFIFNFTNAAKMVAVPAMSPVCALVPCEALVGHLPDGFADDIELIPVRNGREVSAALDGGYSTWKAYRDRIVRECSEDSG